MLVLESNSHQFTRNPFRSELPSLLSDVGAERFVELITGVVQSILQCNQMTVFAFRKNRPPRSVGLFVKERADEVKSAARSYVDTHWRRDPSNLFQTHGIETGRGYAVVLSDRDVSDESFRHDCYTKPGVSHRLSVISEYRGECIKTSFHRKEVAGAFNEGNIHDLLDHCDLLTSLIMRHSELYSAKDNDCGAEHFETLLEAHCPQLTNRERQVCSLIAVGMSSEAIALTLDVSINTILTFRRRAYARLNISTQNELLRRLLRN